MGTTKEQRRSPEALLCYSRPLWVQVALASGKLALTKKYLLCHIVEPWEGESCMRTWGTTTDELLPRLPLFTFPVGFFFYGHYNIKQLHSLVLSSKILERSSYYLSFDEGSSLEWLSSGWTAEIKRKKAILRWGHWMPTQQPFSFFLLSSQTLILFRYLLPFA